MPRVLAATGPDSEFERIRFAATRSLWRREQQPTYWTSYEKLEFMAFLAARSGPFARTEPVAVLGLVSPIPDPA